MESLCFCTCTARIHIFGVLLFTASCPIRGQYYSSGGCLPVGATCDDPNPPLLCDAFTCVCPDGQVISPDANRCINVAECRKLLLYIVDPF